MEKQINELCVEFGNLETGVDIDFANEVSATVAQVEQELRVSAVRRRKQNSLPLTAGYTRSQSVVSSSLISSDEEDSKNDEGGEDVAHPKKAGAQALTPFWSSIAPYIRDITEADLQLLLPTNIPEDDPIWMLPPLKATSTPASHRHGGSNRAATSSQHSHDPSSSHRHAAGSAAPSAHRADDISVSDDFLGCGDLTQRILSALVEENLVHKSNKQSSRGPSFQSATDLPMNKAPTPLYSQANMLSLEDRIKMELKAIGLLGPSFTQNTASPAQTIREDDEISSEIRSLQSQLREQIRCNNERKYRLYQLACKVMKAQEQEKHYRSLDSEVERIYHRAAASEKRSRNRKRRH
jgi:transcriptional adapter 3